MAESEPGTFLIVNIASLRARQLMQGAAPLIRTRSRKPAAIAIREVQKGLVPYYMTPDAPSLGSEDVEEEDE
ncbi:MAG TPA: DNA-directed RNA polymerase subunit omega [Vicinamibacteria bacterium]